MSARSAFLAGERPEDVAIYLAEDALENADALAERAERVDGGYVLVLRGERAREVFSVITGAPPMEFAQEASEREGAVDRALTGGDCPEGEGDRRSPHQPRFVLAFVQERTDDAGGLYAEGDVVHAYAQCACGVAYSDRWLAEGSSNE